MSKLKRKTKEDYDNVGKTRGIKHIGDIPDNIATPTSWECDICGWPDTDHEWNARYHDISHGMGCPNCAGVAKKNIVDYQILAELYNLIYLAEIIPKDTHKSVPFWKCKKCGDIKYMSYGNINRGKYVCRVCFPFIQQYESFYKLNDYQNIGKNRNIIYFLDYIPQNVGIPIEGWRCCINQDHIWKTSYSKIQQGRGCPHCAGNYPRDLEDYQNVGIHINVSYFLEYIPKNTQELILGWECKICKTPFKSCYRYINSGKGCPNCPYKSERLCREIIEGFLLEPFSKARPDWLKYKKGCNLELDGYNEELGIAFEYQGIQHYQYAEHFHKTKEEFRYQLEKDKWKREQCKKQGVFLMEIPYIYSYRDPIKLRDFIYDYIKYRNPFGGILARYLRNMQYHIGRLKELCEYKF